MATSIIKTALLLAGLHGVTAVNFAYESTQLTEADIKASPSLAFGNVKGADTSDWPKCRPVPGDKGWPSQQEWATLNKTVGGRLLAPSPPGAVCYPSRPEYSPAACDFLTKDAANTRYYLDHPINMMTSWTEGNSCLPATNTTSTCVQGGFPTYVVNATTVRDVQAAVNFARNNKLRLVVKNTGHDFLGRSTGHGALSIWVHHLKETEYIQSTTIGEWKGPVAKVSAGTEAFEAYQGMSANNLTLVVTGASSVSAIGGWAQGGGHSIVTSYYGLGADQYLSINVVTADGKFVTADVNTNKDLFYALRGGGPGNYGIVTSAIVKAYPGNLTLSGGTWAGVVGPTDPGSFTTTSPFKTLTPTLKIDDKEVLWKAFRLYLAFVPNVTAIGGMGFGDFEPLANDSTLYVNSFVLPGKTKAEAEAFLAPFYASLRAIGLNLPDPPTQSLPYSQPAYKGSEASGPSKSAFASRLWPRKNWDDPALFNKSVEVIRKVVTEGGYRFRCRNFAPTLKAGGYLAGTETTSANPVWRETLMHNTVFIKDSMDKDVTSTEEFKAKFDRLDKYIDEIRAITPGGGAYINEASVVEPDFKKSFFGSQYPKLESIKSKVDPWHLFWAPRSIGSDEWEVRSVNGLPTQNGPLCKTRK